MNESPELKNYKEIEERLRTGTPAQVEMAIGLAMQSLTIGIVNLQVAIRGPLSQVWKEIEKLNKSLTSASSSSENLSRAIKNATLAGAIIAGIGVFIAATALIWDIYKTLVLKI